MSFKTEIRQDGKNVSLTFTGILDESAQLPEFSEVIEGKLSIDLKDLSMINSLGCRKWILWIRDKAKARHGVHLYRCSSAMVNQISILHGFLTEDVVVESILVPYTCEECRFEHMDEVVVTSSMTDANVPEHMTCPSCKVGRMALDVVRDRYLQFLKKQAA
jgi:hypothetical protein